MHPLLLVLVAKKAVAATVYYGVQRYGVARAYRRSLEAVAALPPGSRREARDLVRTAFVAPARLAALLHDPGSLALYGQMVQALKRAPGALSAAAAALPSLSSLSGGLAELGAVLREVGERAGKGGTR
jgi:hypothetical protein